MLNRKIPPTPISKHSTPTQVRQWLANQQDLASHLILIAIESDCLVIHEATEGEWLASLDWSGTRIMVIEPANIMSPYAFRGFNNAFSFIDTLLLHHFIKTSKTHEESAALASLGALAG